MSRILRSSGQGRRGVDVFGGLIVDRGILLGGWDERGIVTDSFCGCEFEAILIFLHVIVNCMVMAFLNGFS